MIKNAFFLFAICWLGTSCAPKYGCPFWTEAKAEPPKNLSATFEQTGAQTAPVSLQANETGKFTCD